MAEVAQSSLGDYVLRSLNDGRLRADIEAELMAEGHDERFVKEIVHETVKLRYARRRSQGLAFILVGALICFASFLLTITASGIQGNFSFILYGLTTVGIIFVFSGFTMVF
jgi:hypothetical protein